jgi:ATP-binding cassette subfamily B protein
VRATNGGRSTVKEKLRTVFWGFKIAWKIDKKMLLLWSALSVGLSILPAIALGYNREVVSRITGFIVGGTGTFAGVVPSIVALGVIMTLIGLSTRINADLIYMMMYDSYYLGMEELLMDSVQKIELTDLLKSELNDEYRYIVDRGGSLTDLMSGFCSIVGKVVSFTSLLVVAYASSKTVFAISLAYIVGVFILNFSFTERVRWDGEQVRKDNRMASYFEKMPEAPGTAKEIRIYENTEDIVAQWKRSYASVARNEKNRQFAIELRNFISGIGFYVFLIVMMVFSISDVARSSPISSVKSPPTTGM